MTIYGHSHAELPGCTEELSTLMWGATTKVCWPHETVLNIHIHPKAAF